MIPNQFIPSIPKEQIATLPVIEFQGSIQVIDKVDQIQEACEILRKSKVVGFDTETRPSFKAGVTYKVSLLQLSTSEHNFLFRINKTPLDKPILKLFEDPNIVKVGVGILGDLRALRALRHFTPRNFVELQDIAPQWGIEDKSLVKLAAIVLEGKVSKAQRLSNWEATTLTERQIAYAATDSWVCAEIYNKLINTTKKE